MTTRHLSAFGTSALFHASMVVGLMWSVAVSVSRSAGAAAVDHAMPVFAAAPADDPAQPGLNPAAEAKDEVMIRRDGDSPTLSVPGFTFDVSKISDHPALLFPFLSPGLRLEYFGLAASHSIRAEQWRSASNPADDAARDKKPPLALSDASLQKLMDASWSRRDRWTAFQHVATLADRFSGTSGKLPAVLHAYLEQDGLQPYVDNAIPDPRLWVELGIAADHVRFIGFISRYAAAHPATEATTELLLLLDACAQANLDALTALVSTDLRALEWTRRENRGAYELIADVQTYYRAQLAERHVNSNEALAAYFDSVRLGILNGILDTTPHGYRASDARYLVGAIYWKEGKTAAAIRTWRALSPDPTDRYASASADILAALREPSTAQQNGDITRALDREHGRWVSRSFDRLRTFGFRFDTF
jgi:hypothetical protein